jgi:hypothetical protein
MNQAVQRNRSRHSASLHRPQSVAQPPRRRTRGERASKGEYEELREQPSFGTPR